MAELGFQVEEEMISWSTPDEVIQEACRGAQVQFISVTADFRERGRVNEFYFKWDGHLNRAGHSAFGELAGRLVRPWLVHAAVPAQADAP
jgi:hypothetical protein